MKTKTAIGIQKNDRARRKNWKKKNSKRILMIFRLDALALSVIATATWLGRWVAVWVAG